jgi:hypothetical protein
MSRSISFSVIVGMFIGTCVLLILPGPAAIQPTTTVALIRQPLMTVSTLTEATTLSNSCASPDFFKSIWDTHQQLGCPTASATANIDFQKFRRGITMWREPAIPTTPGTVYAFYYNSKRWESLLEPGGPPRPSCEEGKLTGFGPIFSFGTLWCEPSNWKSRLGNPLVPDTASGGNHIQDFENGTILAVQADGFILYPNGKWESFNP